MPRRTSRPTMMAMFIGLAAACLSTLGGCGNGDSTRGPEAAGSRTFNFINRGDIITLDLNQMSYTQDFRVTYAIREGLYIYDSKTSEPIPAIAREATTSDDKKVWTFKLRDDAKWSNGDPVTAEDFAFSWRTMLKTPSEYGYLYYYIHNAERYEKSYRDKSPMSDDELGIKVLDPHTLQVTLTNPVPFLPDLLAFPPFYPRHAKSMEKFRNADGSYQAAYTRPDNVVLNGAYTLAEWESGKRLVLKKNAAYWDAANVKSDTIEMVVNNDPQSAFVQYDKGRVDWLADVSPEIAAKLKEAGRKDLRISPAYGTAFLTFNVTDAGHALNGARNPLADVRVRQALAMSVDRKYIVEKITRMGEAPARAYVPPGYFKNYVSTPAPDTDVEKAKALLAEAGYAGGQNFPTLSICYNSDNPTRKALSEYLAQTWGKNLGIKLELRPLELKTYRTAVTQKDYSIACVSWYGDYLDLTTWTDKYLSTSLQNDTGWGPKAYDELCAAANREPDVVKRSDLLQKAEAMINTELPILPLYYYVNVMLNRDNVKGLDSNPKNVFILKNVSVDR